MSDEDSPCSGSETRELLAHKSRDIQDKATSALEQGKASVQRAATKLVRNAQA